jgi:hypothetical protein
MFKFFSSKPNVDIHMIVTDQGQEKYVEIDTNTTMRDAYGKIQAIASDLDTARVTEVNEGIEAVGYIKGRKVILGAYDQESFKAGSIDI